MTYLLTIYRSNSGRSYGGRRPLAKLALVVSLRGKSKEKFQRPSTTRSVLIFAQAAAESEAYALVATAAHAPPPPLPKQGGMVYYSRTDSLNVWMLITQ